MSLYSSLVPEVFGLLYIYTHGIDNDGVYIYKCFTGTMCVVYEYFIGCFSFQVMRKAHQYLVSKGKAPSSEQSFKMKLYELWFKVSPM